LLRFEEAPPGLGVRRTGGGAQEPTQSRRPS
jgi:hypothetical protein